MEPNPVRNAQSIVSVPGISRSPKAPTLPHAPESKYNQAGLRIFDAMSGTRRFEGNPVEPMTAVIAPASMMLTPIRSVSTTGNHDIPV